MGRRAALAARFWRASAPTTHDMLRTSRTCRAVPGDRTTRTQAFAPLDPMLSIF
jgi:hypothetical protein